MNVEWIVLIIITSMVSAEEGIRIYTNEGDTVNLTCMVNSTLEVTWLVPPRLTTYVVGGAIHTQKYPNFKLHRSENAENNILQIQNFSRMNEGCYRCQTELKDFDYEIIIYDIPSVNIEVRPYNLKEGDQITLTCKHDSTDPHAKISWIPECYTTTMGNSSTCVIDKVNRTCATVYTCEVASGSNIVRNTTTLQIQYAPDIDIYYTVLNSVEVELECVPNGVPDAYTFSPWEYKSKFGTILSYMSNSSKILGPMHSAFSGHYVCNVTNGIHDKKGKLWIQKAYQLNFSESPLLTENFNALSTEEAIYVSWHCNFNDEYPQLFYIEFRRESEYIWHKHAPIVNATSLQQCNVLLGGLKANARYCIRLRLEKRSLYTNETCIFTKEKGISMAVLACFLGAAVLVFISVTACYWAFECKARKSNSDGQNFVSEEHRSPTETQLQNISTANHQLQYTQVWFKPVPKKRKLCVHGTENKNQYADIDLTIKAEPLPESESEESNSENESANELYTV